MNNWRNWKNIGIIRAIFTPSAVPQPVPAPAPKCDREVIDSMVLRELLHAQNISGSMFDSIATLEYRNAKLKRIREWATQLPEKVVRAKYLSWLNHFEQQNNSFIKKIKNPPPKRTGPSDYEILNEKIEECEKLSPLPRFPL